jgi:tetratricopeptide (TPR) repeat protein
MPTGISDIKDYNSLYSAYARLRTEGDSTASAKNAESIFGQKIDIDGDNTAELWELMQKANDAHNKIIFNEIQALKIVQNNKYPQISEDDPINIILSIESEVTGKEKTAKAYAVINDIIKAAKEKITDPMSPFEKLQKLYGIIRDDFHVKFDNTTMLSEGLYKNEKSLDCAARSFLFVSVAHELGWPVYLMSTEDHAFVFWRSNERSGFGFETTNGDAVEPAYVDRLGREAEQIVKNDKNDLFAAAYNIRGFEYHIAGKDTLAIRDFTTAIELEPVNTAMYYYNRGHAYYKLGQYELARKDWDKSLKLREKK